MILAINYGARDEIKRATLEILQDYDNNRITKDEITEKVLSKYLDTKNNKDTDLLIRTSGEKRLSNFILSIPTNGINVPNRKIAITQTVYKKRVLSSLMLNIDNSVPNTVYPLIFFVLFFLWELLSLLPMFLKYLF